MFRPTSPQLSLLESRFLDSGEKRRRLLNFWAEIFRRRVLPFMDEEPFSAAFDARNGRPNASVRLLIGLHILKENNDLTDMEVLDHLEFNLQWEHTLAVEPASAHLFQKTLHRFRALRLEGVRAQQVLEKTVAAVARLDRSISTGSAWTPPMCSQILRF